LNKKAVAAVPSLQAWSLPGGSGSFYQATAAGSGNAYILVRLMVAPPPENTASFVPTKLRCGPNRWGGRIRTRKALPPGDRRPMPTFRTATWLLTAVLAAACSKPAPPQPDGSSGVEGTCLLAAVPAEKGEKAPARHPWAGVAVNAREAEGSHTFTTTTDMAGRFRLPLNPGEYVVEMHDRVRLMGKTHTPLSVRVEPGSFTEVVVDYDELNVRKTPGR
jgi:hypothetical protein